MAKHRHKEQESSVNDKNKNMNNMNNMNSMNNNNPFGIDPMQLMNLLGGNFDMRNMTNMLASMNTNGFNLSNLGPLAQMAGLNLDNNIMYGNGFSNPNDTMNSDVNTNNKNVVPNMNNINLDNKENSSDTTTSIKKNEQEKNIKESKISSNSANINAKVKITQNNDLEFLVSLKGIVNQEKVPLINKIIELYKSGAFKDK